MIGWVMAGCVVLGADDAAAITKLLDRALLADKDAARPLVKQALELLEERKLPASERDRLSRHLVRVLRHVIQSPGDVQAVFSSGRVRVSRQVVYNHYRELWTTDHTPVLRMVFDCRKGKDAVLSLVESVGR